MAVCIFSCNRFLRSGWHLHEWRAISVNLSLSEFLLTCTVDLASGDPNGGHLLLCSLRVLLLVLHNLCLDLRS